MRGILVVFGADILADFFSIWWPMPKSSRYSCSILSVTPRPPLHPSSGSDAPEHAEVRHHYAGSGSSSGRLQVMPRLEWPLLADRPRVAFRRAPAPDPRSSVIQAKQEAPCIAMKMKAAVFALW